MIFQMDDFSLPGLMRDNLVPAGMQGFSLKQQTERRVKWMFNRQLVSSVGRVSDYRAGGPGFEPQNEPTLRVLK